MGWKTVFGCLGREGRPGAGRPGQDFSWLGPCGHFKPKLSSVAQKMAKLGFCPSCHGLKKPFFEKSVSMKYLGSKSVKNKKVAYWPQGSPQKIWGQWLQYWGSYLRSRDFISNQKIFFPIFIFGMVSGPTMRILVPFGPTVQIINANNPIELT